MTGTRFVVGALVVGFVALGASMVAILAKHSEPGVPWVGWAAGPETVAPELPIYRIQHDEACLYLTLCYTAEKLVDGQWARISPTDVDFLFARAYIDADRNMGKPSRTVWSGN